MGYFCNLHGHNQFSTFDGMGNSRQAAATARKCGYDALGLTNHGTVAGLIEHYQACNDEGIKPIAGCEIYYMPEFESGQKYGYSHLTILVKDFVGWKNLMTMLTEANKNNYYRMAVVDRNLLQKYSEGLICLSGCISCMTCRYFMGYTHRKTGEVLMEPDVDAARNNLLELRSIFGKDFYLEVMPVFGIPKQQIYNDFVIGYGEENKVPVVMTLDAHYPSKDDFDTYVVLRTMGNTANAYTDDIATSDYKYRYLMDYDEARKSWMQETPSDPKQFLENTGLVVEKCNLKIDFGDPMPHIDWGKPTRTVLVETAIANLKEKGKWNRNYEERLKYELNTIFTKGFEDYFLLCRKIIKRAEERDIGTNFGRGSVCGSLLAYALDITKVDPIVFDTPFERFLRPNKNVLPDIDMDFDARRQHEMIDVVIEDFPDRSARFSTIGRFKEKNLINDLIKHYGIDKEEGDDDEFIKSQVLEVHEHLGEADYQKFLDERESMIVIDKTYEGIIKHYCKLFKHAKYIGKHAAGVLITKDLVHYYDAIQRKGSGDNVHFQTSHDMDQLQDMGLLKMDILGLRHISIIKDIEDLTGIKWDEKFLEDDAVYKAFSKGRTQGTFQFDKWSAIKVLKDVKPENFNELCACNALNRPGPKMSIDGEMSTLDKYVAIKKGELEVDKNTPWYPYCQDTYGLLIYQEQMMWICRKVAGLDWDTTDQIVKQLSKKVEEKRQKLKKPFVEGCVQNGIDRKEAEDFYEKNTLYGFNKSHSVAYTLLSVYGMWLKINYNLEFWWAVLKNEEKDKKRDIYTACAARDGIIFFYPHINGLTDYEIVRSNKQLGLEIEEDVIGEEKVIRMGLSSIKGLGSKAVDWIVEHQPYVTPEQWEATCEKKNKANRKAINKTQKKKIEMTASHALDKKSSEHYINCSLRYTEDLMGSYRRYS